MPKEKETASEKEQFLREAVTELDHLYRVAFHLAPDSDEAHDLVQDTYARAIGARDGFTLGSNMKAWLTKILYNVFFDRYRQTKRRTSIEDRAKDATDCPEDWAAVRVEKSGPENYALARELNSKITAALRKLPQDFRTPILLVDMEGLSYAEAAEVLACPVGTIRSRISRGRKLLHESLKPYVLAGTK